MDGSAPLKLEFKSSEPLTLGVELELQLLDRETLDLKACSPQILSHFGPEETKVKAEIFQSMLEINTGICKNAHDVRIDLADTIKRVQTVASQYGVRLASSGTHPFALYRERKLYPDERYKRLIDRNQWIARRLLIFGLHVHIGMRSGQYAIDMNNALLHYLPLLLALSASSPYWDSEDTELASSRITFFESVPTGGHPCLVQDWQDFELLYERLLKAGAIQSPKDIWWDLRPSPEFGTLEIRVCDGPATLEETVALTALIHCLSHYIDKQIMSGRRFGPPPLWLLRENKWRASRHGLDAQLILNEKAETVSLKVMLESLLHELAPLISEYGYKKEIDLLKQVVEKGASYQRQRAVAAKAGGDLKQVMRFLASEFEAMTPQWSDEQ